MSAFLIIIVLIAALIATLGRAIPDLPRLDVAMDSWLLDQLSLAGWRLVLAGMAVVAFLGFLTTRRRVR